MKKINRQRVPKGTVTIMKKGNSYEARVTLALNSIMEGVDKNPRLSRTARSEKEARKRLGELVNFEQFYGKSSQNKGEFFTVKRKNH